MTCPECGGKTKVIDTVNAEDAVYRKRFCVDCGRIFFTTEEDSDSTAFFRAKRDLVRDHLASIDKPLLTDRYSPRFTSRRDYVGVKKEV